MTSRSARRVSGDIIDLSAASSGSASVEQLGIDGLSGDCGIDSVVIAHIVTELRMGVTCVGWPRCCVALRCNGILRGVSWCGCVPRLPR